MVGYPSSCSVIGVTVMKDGIIVGIGTDNCLYTRATLNGSWVKVPNSGSVISVAVMQDGKILGVETGGWLMAKGI